MIWEMFLNETDIHMLYLKLVYKAAGSYALKHGWSGSWMFQFSFPANSLINFFGR